MLPKDNKDPVTLGDESHCDVNLLEQKAIL
jgi:hypothetical protein